MELTILGITTDKVILSILKRSIIERQLSTEVMEKIDFETQKVEFDAIFVSSSKNVENETKKNYLKIELPLT